MAEMQRVIEICIGSACHLKGSYQAIQRIKELIDENGMGDTIEIKSSFCLGSCGNGVSMRVDGDQCYSVQLEDIDTFFNDKVRSK